MSVLDRFRLDGKRLFITGGSRGLGREMALAIASAGADVILVGRDKESLENTANDAREMGREAAAMQADVGDPDICEQTCREALDKRETSTTSCLAYLGCTHYGYRKELFSNALEVPFLQDAQEFALHLRRDLPDLIEEQRTLVR